MEVRGPGVRRLGPAVARDSCRGSSPAPGRRRAGPGSCRSRPATCSSGRGCCRRSMVSRPAIAAGRTRSSRAVAAPSRKSVRGARRIATVPRPRNAPSQALRVLGSDDRPGGQGHDEEGEGGARGPGRPLSARQGHGAGRRHQGGHEEPDGQRGQEAARLGGGNEEERHEEAGEEEGVAAADLRPVAREGDAGRGEDEHAHAESRGRHVVAEEAGGPGVEGVEAEERVLQDGQPGEGQSSHEGRGRAHARGPLRGRGSPPPGRTG